MEEITVKDITYRPAESVRMQGDVTQKQQSSKKGYGEVKNRSGSKVLSRSAMVLVTFADGNETRRVNMKYAILDYYGRTQMTEKLADEFKKDVEEGKIRFEKDQEGKIRLKSCEADH